MASTGLGLVASGAAVVGASGQAAGSPKAALPQRPLGKTGRQVSLYGLGGLFTAAWYGTGASELNIGTVMKTRRKEVL